MDGDTLYSIGDLARRTGLTVKAIRFYSDRGIVPPTDRSPAGYRLYGIDAVARLDLVRTLRDLGLDLPTIRRVVDREISLPEVASARSRPDGPGPVPHREADATVRCGPRNRSNSRVREASAPSRTGPSGATSPAWTGLRRSARSRLNGLVR
ncbi:MerR family transcriptional regulator [Streptosporangium canum]|uniref:MerR family transcriptional regulator n=1 Tax=Streptosporangium canum TaxID=324952 RepID=UPI00368B6A4C